MIRHYQPLLVSMTLAAGLLLIGGIDANAQNVIGISTFTGQALTPAANVPEPGSMAVLGAFSLLLAHRLHRKHT